MDDVATRDFVDEWAARTASADGVVFDFGGVISVAPSRIFADAGAGEPTAEDFAAIWRLDIEGWIRELRPDTLALMRRIKADGRKVGILTNMSPDFYEKLFVARAAEYRALADAEVVSGLVRLYKPQPEIYALMERRIGLPAGRLFFLDDLQKNVDAARGCGWQAELYPALR